MEPEPSSSGRRSKRSTRAALVCLESAHKTSPSTSQRPPRSRRPRLNQNRALIAGFAQAPVPPFPYLVKEVTVNASVALACTVTRPRETQLVAGSWQR